MLEYPIQHTKFQGHRPLVPKKKIFYPNGYFFFTIYGMAAILVMTWTVWTKRLHMKFGFNRPSGFRGDVWKCWYAYIDTHTHTHTHTYGRQRPTYTISSPMSIKAQVSLLQHKRQECTFGKNSCFWLLNCTKSNSNEGKKNDTNGNNFSHLHHK